MSAAVIPLRAERPVPAPPAFAAPAGLDPRTLEGTTWLAWNAARSLRLARERGLDAVADNAAGFLHDTARSHAGTPLGAFAAGVLVTYGCSGLREKSYDL